VAGFCGKRDSFMQIFGFQEIEARQHFLRFREGPSITSSGWAGPFLLIRVNSAPDIRCCGYETQPPPAPRTQSPEAALTLLYRFRRGFAESLSDMFRDLQP
jgi:hypothetical protein